MVSTPKCSLKSVVQSRGCRLQGELLVDGQIGVVVDGVGHRAFGHDAIRSVVGDVVVSWVNRRRSARET